MNTIWHKIGAATLAVILLLSPYASVYAQQTDVETLSKALTKALGKETNDGLPRLLGIKTQVNQGKRTLLIAVTAHKSPTHTGIQIGALGDAVKVFKILKSWHWPEKVDQVVIGGYIRVPGKAVDRVQPILTLQIASDKIGKIDWNSIEPKDVPDKVDSIQLHDISQ